MEAWLTHLLVAFGCCFVVVAIILFICCIYLLIHREYDAVYQLDNDQVDATPIVGSGEEQQRQQDTECSGAASGSGLIEDPIYDQLAEKDLDV